MPRRARQAIGGLVYHVINRGCGRMRLFGGTKDYEGFVKLLEEALRRIPGMRLLAFCLMPNHWHLVLLPGSDGDLSKFMFWLTMTHVQRWRHSRRLVGLGPLYQGRFRAFAVEEDAHFLTVGRYVERNALRAKLVAHAEDWQWCSAYLRLHQRDLSARLLSEWPVDMPSDWSDWLNQPQTDREIEEIRRHIRQSRPYGNHAWQARTAKLLGIDLTPKRAGRPKGPTRKKISSRP